MQKTTKQQNQSSTDSATKKLTVRDILLMDGVPEEEIEEYLKNLPKEYQQ